MLFTFIFFRKKNLFMETLENKMLEMAAFGIMDKLKSISVPDPINYVPDEPLNPLTLEHFFLSFVFLAGGLATALIILFIECFVNKRVHKKFI